MSAEIKVAIKVRNLIEREESEGLIIQWEVKNNSIFQKDSAGKLKECYLFDHVFDPRIKNFEVFNTIARPIVDSSVGGFNGTIFAYGQTSSGKTYTMMGSPDEPGIIPLTIQYIFEAVNKVKGREFLLRASYIEIYNEKVNDLLEKGKTGLKLREVEGSVIICGLKEEVVHTPEKFMHLMKRGENIRRFGETNMNERSSRSHTIFRIIIESRVPNEGENGAVQVSHLNLVDLAGSERVDQTGSKGDRLKEGCSINRSLFMLSHVISQLSEGQDQYVSFRDSKLTRILQSSLGGNAHTAIICAVTPASIEQTASTLGFASRAIRVKNKPQVNEVLSDAALLRRYARQITKLQTELEKTKNTNRIDEVEEIESKLQEQQRHNELLQERIDLLKEKLIGCAATDTIAMDKRRELRRRTWCGRASRKSVFPNMPLETVDEGATSMLPVFKQEYLSSSIQELTGNTFFETPLEEFELQLMHAESRLSQDSIVSPERPSCNITVRKGKKQHVTFEDQAEYTGYQSKDTVEMGSQTDAFPINFSSHSTDTLQSNFNETPPRVLRERIKHYQKEYDELRDFTVLEKQIYNVGSYKELNQLETENRHLQKSIGDLEAMILDVNCTNSKLSGENKSLKERLEKESEKCNDLTGHFQTLHETEAALSERSQEMVTLKKQLNMANQRIKHLENEKNDFDMIRELAEGNLKRRNEELTHSLEDALMKLKELHQSGSNVLTDDMNNHIQTSKEEDDLVAELKHNSEELTGISTCTVDLNKLQDEMKVLREENSMYIQELKEKNTYLEQLKQENEQLKVNDLSAHLDSAKEELNSLQEINLFYVGQLKEKDEHLEMLTKLIEELNSEKAESVKDIHDSKENNVRQVEQNGNFAEIGTCTSDFVAQEDDSVYGGHRAYVEQLVEKDNYLEIAKQSIEDQDSVKDADLKDVEQLQDEIRCLELLKMDNEQLKEQNLLYIEQLKEKDRSLEILKHQIEDLNSVKIANLKYVDELEEIDFTGHKEIISLEEDNSMCIEKPKERDDYLEMLTRQIDSSDPVKKYNFNYNEQLQKKEKCPEVMLQQNELQGTNTEGLSGVQDDAKSEEGDNSLHTLTQQTRDSDSAKEANFKCFEQLQDTCLGQLTQEFEELKGSLLNTQEMSSIRDEVKSVVENNLTGNEQLKVKDECLELPEKKIDQNIELNITERKRNEENLFHAEQSREISNHNEMLKHHIEDLDCMKVADIKCINELKEKIISLHKEINMLKDENSVYIKQLREKDDYLQILTQQIEELNSTRESDLKCSDEFKENNIKQQDEIVFLKEEISSYLEQLKERDNHFQTLKQQIEDMNSVKEFNLKCIDELNLNNIRLQEKINCLNEENSMYKEQMMEKDNNLEAQKQQIEDLNSVKEDNLKSVDELRKSNVGMREEIDSLKEEISMYSEQLAEKDNYIETLKQELKALDNVKEINIKYTDDLKQNYVKVQDEIMSLKEENSTYIKQLKEKDNNLEAQKQQIEDLNSVKEDNLKSVDELRKSNVGMQEEIDSLKEEISMYSEQLAEKDNYIETLKQELKALDNVKEINIKYTDDLKQNYVKVQDEIMSLKEENSTYIKQLKEKDNHLEAQKQQIEDLNSVKEDNLKSVDELRKSNVGMQEEIDSLKKEISMYSEQLAEKDNYIETLKQELKALDNVKGINIKYTDDLKQNYVNVEDEIMTLKEENSTYIKQLKEKDNNLEAQKQQIEDLNSVKEDNLKSVDELRKRNVGMQEEIDSLKKEISMYSEQLAEKDNYLETLKQELKALDNVKEINIKYTDDLKQNYVNVQDEIMSLKEENSTFIKQLKEKDNNLEAQKQQIEDFNSVKEDNLKSVDELRKSNVGMQEEIDSLKEEISMYSEQLAEKDNYIETLKQELKALDNVKEINIKYTDDLKQNYVNVQDEIMTLKEENSTYIKQLKEKDNNLEAHKQQIEDLNSVKEDNLKSVDELRKSNVGMQEEIDSLKEEISMYSEQLAEKDNYIETLKQELKALDNVKEINIKYTDDLKQNYVNVEDEIMSLKEENSAFIKQLKEKDNYFQTLKQQIEDLVSVKEANLKYIQQLEKDKYAEVFRTDNNERSYDNGVFTAEVDHCRKELPAESSVIDKSISDMSYEISSCRRAILKEIRCLKPNYDVESVSQVCLTKLLKILLKVVMEKEEEVLHVFQVQMDEVCAKASDYEREYADKDRRKDCWVRELETEVERLQAELTRIEEEKKALKMDDHLDYIKILEQEKADLIKTVRQSDSDLAVVQIEVNSMNEKMKSCDKDMAKKMEDLEFLVEEKDSLICQLKEELESQLKKQADVAVLRKEIVGLEESNAVLNEKLEKRNNDSGLLLEKLEELQCAVLSEKNKTQVVMAKLGSLETELKSLSRKNCDLIEEMNANKEVHSILLKEKECSSEMTLNLKRVTEDLENLMVEKLAWDSEKQESQANLATKQDELNSERNLRCQLEKDVAIVVKMREESGQLQMLQLEDGLQKQKELAMKNENLAVYITELKDQVKKLRDENVSLRASFETLVAEKDGINSEIDDLKKQLQEKASLAADFVRLQEYVQQQQDALCNENRSSIDETDNCAQNLHSESQSLSARLADGMAHENSETELKKLKEKLEICMKEKLALDDENELLVTRIRGLENMLETYCVINNGLEKSKGVLEEDKRRLLSELSDSHRRLSDAESEIRELKSPALKDGSVSQENSILHCSVKELQTENESLRNRNELLFQKNQSANQNIAALHAQYRQLETHLAQRTHVAKLSVATNTDISGSCQCKELGKQVQELKVINAERNNRIGILELQVKAEDFPHRQKVKELQDSLSFYQSKNMELKTDLRRLHKILKHSEQICDNCRKRNSVKPKHVAIQTDEVKDEDFSMAGGGGSGIIREDQLMKMRIRIRELESKNEMLKELCRSRRQRILELEEMLEVHLRSRDKKKEHVSELRDVQVVERPSNRADSLRDAGQVQRSQEFGSGPVNVTAGNKENFLESHKALMRQRRNMYSKNYKPDVRRPLNENISGIQDSDISFED